METTGNAIHALLDRIGLPWRAPEAELARRYGTRCDGPYQQKVVSIPTRPPLLSGLLRPMEVQVSRPQASDLPALEFSGQASQGCDPGFNIRFAASDLEAALGPAVIRKRDNVLCCGWKDGRARVRLTVWPPEWQGLVTNSAHERDPRLVTACHITVATGFRPAPTPQELAWLASYEPFAPIKASSLELMRQYHLEYLRDVDCSADRRDTVGWSKDRDALIFCNDEVHVVAIYDVLGFEVRRILPAKGRGGSELLVACRSRVPGSVKRLNLTRASGPEDLNEMGATLAQALGKPCEIAPHEYDV